MSTLVIETSDGIRSIAINKPAKRNSLSADTLQELSTGLLKMPTRTRMSGSF